MSSINISSLQGLFQTGQQGGYDINGDGKLDRPELAKASLNLLGQQDPNAQATGSLLATFVQGGKDGQGLLPDFNNDQALSPQELAQFAGPSGTISSSNFQSTFANQYQAGGNSLNIDGLKTIAQGNLDKFSSNDPGTFTNALGSLGVQIMPAILKLFTAILGMLSGGQQPPAQ